MREAAGRDSAREKACEAALARQRDDTAHQIQGLHAASRAREAYLPQGHQPLNRLDLCSGDQLNVSQGTAVMDDLADTLELAPLDAADAHCDLQTVLAAWHAATLRLEQTHEALREEVCRLTDELEVKNRELARKNRLADLGQMASHVAHEVRNNLVPVTLYLSLLRRRIAGDAGEPGRCWTRSTPASRALDATVNDLLQFTSDRDPQLQTFRLAAAGGRRAGLAGPAVGGPVDRAVLRRAGRGSGWRPTATCSAGRC